MSTAEPGSEGMDALQTWCKDNGYNDDIYNKLKELDFEEPYDLKLLNDGDFDELCNELGFRLGKKTKLKKLIEQIKKPQPKPDDTNDNNNDNNTINDEVNDDEKKVVAMEVDGDNDGNNDGDNNAEMKQVAETKNGEDVIKLTATTEYKQYPIGQSTDEFYVMVSLKAPYFRPKDRAPIDLVCVVDTSGSMSGERIKLVKETLKFIVNNLTGIDRFGCVGFSERAYKVVDLINMNDLGRDKATKCIEKMAATGSTALCAGLVDGVNMLRKRTIKKKVASILLFTDGQTNVGPNTANGIIKAAKDGTVGDYVDDSDDMYGMYGAPIQRNNMYGYGLNNNMNANMYQQQMSIPQLQQIPPPIPQYIQPVQQYIQPQQAQQSKTVPTPPPKPKKKNSFLQKFKRKKTKTKQNKKKNNNNNNNNNDNNSDNNNSDNGDVGTTKTGSDEELPIINTFGFGGDHNALLLQDISEHARGLYAYIERADMIGETFAECLGGLVSMAAQDLKVTIEITNSKVSINKSINDTYKSEIIKKGKIMELIIPDMQSEEQRDLLFQLKLNKLKKAVNEDVLCKFSLQYHNVIKNSKASNVTLCSINRTPNDVDIGSRDVNIDKQKNRIDAANAMDNADKLGNANNLKEARSVLQNAIKSIQNSISKNDSFCKDLVTDLQSCYDKLKTRNDYISYGSNMMKMNSSAHKQQRAVQSSIYTAQNAYTNCAKTSMMSTWNSQY